MNRIIFLDTETTGLKFEEGHRIVDIAAVESINRVITGRHFHSYVNPLRNSDIKAFEIHQLSEEFLSNKPLFEDIAQEFLEFIGDATLVIHNAQFDLGFINHELNKSRLPLLTNQIIDSLTTARSEIKGLSSYRLDALCDYFKVDRSKRIFHGALLDAELLAEVYLQLTRKQSGLDINSFDHLQFKKYWLNNPPKVREFIPNEIDLKENQELVKKIAKNSPSLW